MDADGWEKRLDHEAGKFEWVVIISIAEAVHDEQGCRLERRAEHFRVALGRLLEFNDVARQCILFNLEDHGGTFGVFYHSQIVPVLGLSDDHHVRDAELPGGADKVLQRVLFRFFELGGSVRVHQISHILQQLSQINANLPSLDNES